MLKEGEETYCSWGVAGGLLLRSLTFLLEKLRFLKTWHLFPETSNIYFRKGQVLSACHLLNTNCAQQQERKACYFIFQAERMNSRQVAVDVTGWSTKRRKCFSPEVPELHFEFCHLKGKMPINLHHH